VNYYEAYFEIKDSRKDLEFAASVARYMEYLQGKGLIEGYRLTRRKLGFGPPELGEFQLSIEVKDLGQLDEAFQLAATRDGEVEKNHAAVYSQIKSVRFALTRDFPDPVRVGAEGDS
jgi:hypothetical protein